jgi:hypothetical protein
LRAAPLDSGKSILAVKAICVYLSPTERIKAANQSEKGKSGCRYLPVGRIKATNASKEW